MSPRVEVVFDASRSMAVSAQKSARAAELALWCCTLAQRAGLQVALVTAGVRGNKSTGAGCAALLESLSLDGRDGFDHALGRAPPLLPCGMRIIISDLLFEAPAEKLAERWARGASGLAVVQLLDPDDVDPEGGYGARLVDSESDDFLERVLTPAVLSDYQTRLQAHLKLWREASQRVRASLFQVAADAPLVSLASGPLAPLTELA